MRISRAIAVLVLAFAALAPAVSQSQEAGGVGWDSNAVTLRGNNSKQFSWICAPNGSIGSVWGTDTYTDDSSVCSAAVHAGAITAGAGGTVIIEIRPGQDSYTGSERNGVKSSSYDKWDGSFIIIRGQAEQTSADGGIGGSGWNADATALRGRNGVKFTFICPPNGTRGKLYGGPGSGIGSPLGVPLKILPTADFYTDDSSVCTAAVHAGLITLAGGGNVTIGILGASGSYTPSFSNGIQSYPWAIWPGSFTFTGVPQGNAPAPAATRQRRAGSANGPHGFPNLPLPTATPEPEISPVPAPEDTTTPAPAPPAGVASGGNTWDATATAYRGQNGTHYAYVCSPNGTFSSVWGTDVYTDDSSVCTAAVHAGMITQSAGGTVTIEIRSGQSSYSGSSHNGVETTDYGSWGGSFIFVGAGAVTPPPSTGEAVTNGGSGWDATAVPLRGMNNKRFRFVCPANGEIGRVWGTDVYTDDGSVCSAAVHAGLITLTDGGTVVIEIRPGQSSYHGSSRNGVDSEDYDSWLGSFVFVH